MRILILAGKDVDGRDLDLLPEGCARTVVRLTSVSRGVRRLEKDDADLVLFVPDVGDDSWPRAVTRVRGEYGRQAIVLVREPGLEAEALAHGAFDCYVLGPGTRDYLAHGLLHLEGRLSLEAQLADERAMLDWMERTDVFGSWVMGRDGDIRWSEGLHRIFGPEAEPGRRLSGLRRHVHPDDLEVFDRANEATFDQGWPLDFEYRAVDGDGKVRHLHVNREVELDPNGGVKRIWGMARDVSLQKEFEELLFRRDAILQVLANFASRFLRKADWNEGVGEALAKLGKVADVTRIYLFRKAIDASGAEILALQDEWEADWIAPLGGMPDLLDLPISPLYDTWRGAMLKRKVVTGHVRHFRKEERAVFSSTGAKSVMIVPVFAGNVWWGFLGLSEHRRERDWLPVEIESMMLAANLFGSAIHYGEMSRRLVEANRSAEEASSAALEANMAKSMFLANMSHEIRTPISGILGMAEMMVTTGLTEEQREHMDMIRDAGKSLLHIINDILDISKIEAGRMELKPRDFTFRSALETSVRSFGPQAELNGLVFRHDVADDVPARLNGDPDRLGQVLWNLIGNAMKFTPRGLVELIVEVVARKEGRVCLQFKVRDTGVGIPEDKLDAVFDSFTQADSSLRKKHQGTGLGLTISRQLVNMMGGEIGVESAVGKGSTFFFTAWFGPAETAEPEPVQARPRSPRALHLNILLADDNPMNRKYLQHFLTMFGHTVVTAENGLEALEVLRDRGRTVDVVLMDVQMPEMSGLEATRAIRESDGRQYDRRIPIIALTAYAMKGDRERMLEAGMDDYVSKPVDMHALSEAIVRCTEDREPSGGRVCRPAPPEPAAKALEVTLDVDGLRKRFEGNMDLYRDILDLFLLEAKVKREALEQGLADMDPKGTAAALHSITNIASHVLAMDLVHLSRQLEKKCYCGEMEAVKAGVAELLPRFDALVRAVAKEVARL
ncbi:multi-sensor hybrid histidine kinase [Pseudodesulfovibrio mercurii]|uniref:Sensory/regulatory protein RpfC n=1 Tax=Pseudodesulfovibrio mercurii TaxID=641491 RepID=F0JI52_9BACT|nr:response regulator [Pseudodesulfovibrio mercurii]EGB15363.1 multi-sensor hybrid histidine kinase [Pseudodesulfovibrio mercurii]